MRLMTVRVMENQKNILIFPTKLTLIPGLMSSMNLSLCLSPFLDAERLDLSVPDQIIENDPRHEHGGQYAVDEADGQCHGEPFDRPGPELEEEHGRYQCGDVGVENGDEGLSVARLDDRPGGLAQPDFFPGPLEDQHVGVHSHTDDQK